jgi:(E)-4-hydroxy-3-methylbut-2-enyl-diphosphate synthase
MNSKEYCIDIFKYNRHTTSEVKIGNLNMGANHPIVVQSMTTTNTNDVSATIEQIKTISNAGGQMVRMTTQGQREANNLQYIKKGLVDDGYTLPLVADIHYNPNAANIAAKHIEKVRINPGNFVDGAKKFETIEYTNESYQEELLQVKKKLIPLLNICKLNNTTLRIGTNHGSLSDRIMSRYGDTPMGMVESCMEFLRICRDENFNQIVLSIKASNARIMVHTVRLLVQTMNEEGMNYPLHLGVTEAGEGDDGRIRSAVGIGTLLCDGIGDTIRVSLTENPENEIPVAKEIIEYTGSKANHPAIQRVDNSNYFPFRYVKRKSKEVDIVGGQQVPVVISNSSSNLEKPDFTYMHKLPDNETADRIILPYKQWIASEKPSNYYPCFSLDEYCELDSAYSKTCFVKVLYAQMDDDFANKLKNAPNTTLVLQSENTNSVAEQRAAFLWLINHNINNPVIIHRSYKKRFTTETQIKASCDLGPLFMDGFGDGAWIEADAEHTPGLITSTVYSILQAARVRFSKTDYISCPGCGRTLFNLQETTAHVKEKTAHLKGLKIAVMGCIVNGPGEMADADYGYVGSGPGKITLYHQREIIKKNIDEINAVDELIQLIKENGDWIES